MVGRGDVEGSGKHWYLQSVGTVILGEYAVAVNLCSAHDSTGNRLTRGSVDDGATDGARLILLLLWGKRTY